MQHFEVMSDKYNVNVMCTEITNSSQINNNVDDDRLIIIIIIIIIINL
jgi:hypothetical protein